MGFLQAFASGAATGGTGTSFTFSVTATTTGPQELVLHVGNFRAQSLLTVSLPGAPDATAIFSPTVGEFRLFRINFQADAVGDVLTAKWEQTGSNGTFSNLHILAATLSGPSGDTTPPVVTAPTDITEEATGPTGAVVNFVATALDDIDGPLTPTCVPASGSTFPLSDTTVTCTAEDAAGNVGSDDFLITVEDTTAPLVTAPADQTADASDADGAVVTYPAATATDAVCVVTGPDCLPASGSTFPIGATLVTCTAADAAGNEGEDTFAVTVLAPRLTKLEVLASLQPFEAESKRIKKAIDAIEKSLEAKRWLDDTHLTKKHGHKVFNDEKKAVKELAKALDKDALSPAAAAAAAEAIDRLVQLDRVLAEIAIAQALAAPVLDPDNLDDVAEEIAKAQSELAKGDADLAAGKPDKAINHYKKAWEKAQKAICEAAEPPDDDDDDDDDDD